MDYYKILNLKDDASLSQIEQAYKDLSSFYNPDSNVSKLAYKKYRMVNKAYHILKEIKEKQLYMLEVKAEQEVINNDNGNLLSFDEFGNDKYKIDKEIDEYALNELSIDYDVIKVKVPYLYYLLHSEYQLNYTRPQIISKHGVCCVCDGKKVIKKDNKVVYCNHCLKTGNEIETRQILVSRSVRVEDRVVIEDDNIIIDFEYIDKDEYTINGNEILYRHVVDKDEYYNGLKLILKSNYNALVIEEKEFKELSKRYVFLDKVINIEYILDEYIGVDIKGYIVTDKDCVYVCPKDYTYSFISTDKCNVKVNLESKIVKVNNLGLKGYNSDNGNLILEVIKLENNEDLKIFFDKEIKKVSSWLFRINGSYNGHYFKGKKIFDYDDNYLYIPNKAHTLETKYFTLFRVIFSVAYLLIPLILILIFGVSKMFFIMSGILLLIYLLVVNIIMEVKI